MANKKAGEAGEAPGAQIILEKHLVGRADIDDSLKRMLLTVYKGETHSAVEWFDIIKRRLERPAV